MTEQECVACGRPAKDDRLPICEEHEAAYSAAARHEEWEICATALLPPLLELARQFGNEPLQEVLQDSMEYAEEQAEAYKVEAEQLRESLG